MMKWGGRKTSSASSASVSHASPFSWLSKLKHMRINSEPNHGKMKQKAKQNSTSAGSPQYSCGNGSGFYAGDGDALWRASFGEKIHEDKKSEDIEENVVASSSCPTGRRDAKKHGTREGTLKFKEKDIDIGEERKLLNDSKVSREMDEYNREKEYEHLRRRFERKAQSVLQEQLLKLEREAAEVEFASSKVVEKDVLQFESPRTICTPRIHSFASSSDSKNSNTRNIVESFEKTGKQSQKKLSSERQNLKQTEELKVRTKKKKQTLDVSRAPQRRKSKHSPRVRIHSPRMASKVEICKIKAVEDMRKAKLKMKKEREEVAEETPPCPDSFAVIKRSLDPKQDFRDSMIEMIMEKQIRQPEEMEELLACYLALNADEYHDLIIKVFRQVWFDMSQHGLGIKSDMQCCCCE